MAPRHLLVSVPVAVVAMLAGCAGGGGGGGDDGARPRSAGPAPAQARWPTPARYELDLAYDARRFALAGTQRIVFANTGPAPLRSVWLRTWGNASGSCAAPRVRVTVASGGRAGARRRGCTALEVTLERPLARGERGELGLRIAVSTPPRPDRFGRARGVAYFGNALPVLAVADRRGWQLPPYTFAGESFYSLTAAWQVRVRADEGVRVASTGTQVEDAGNGVVLEAPRSRDFMLAIGPMAVREAREGAVRLRHFAPTGARGDAARRVLAVARLSLRTYARRYGPYDRPELDLVQGPGGLAMEYPELVLTPSSPTAVAHEIAHQWWYAIVGNDQWTEPWLDESLAEYSAARLPPRRVPNRLRDCRLPDARRVPLDATMRRLTAGSEGRYVEVAYIGGGCTLRALQRAIGTARFDAILRDVVADHRDGVLTTAAFVAALPDEPGVRRILERVGLR